ncbi:MAG: hypothetical protein ACQGVC_12320 [Myxococcota bacterium]
MRTIVLLLGSALIVAQAGCGAPAPAVADADCLTLDQLFAEKPDATAEEIHAAEQCMKARARASGRSGRNTRFLGNTYDRPEGALAHYKGWSTGSTFTVFEDHIHTTEDFGATETRVPFASVTGVEEGWPTPGTLQIEYTDEQGHEDALSFLLMNPEDVEKEEGARDVDRLRELIESLRAEQATS